MQIKSLVFSLFVSLSIFIFTGLNLNAKKDYLAMDPAEASKILLRKQAVYSAYREEAKGLLAHLQSKKNDVYSNRSIEYKIEAANEHPSGYLFMAFAARERLSYEKIAGVLQNLIDELSFKAKRQLFKLTKEPKSQSTSQELDWVKAFQAALILRDISISAESYMDDKILSQLASAKALSSGELSRIETESFRGNGILKSQKFLEAINQFSLMYFLERKAMHAFVKPGKAEKY